ncbi:26S proteasome non-ATPase regulatory subunit 13-like [Cimex lectularius]|uniref:26S proteasome non-ATPase regulatory subunit 13 n=1 Tax=Cimex lectularius TaxID=79782 RepID=A0A8I6SJ45_CIMLE|nr:26S proteasome non-ATPase regulatory subunit 13-like [Cimex lectularius]
MVSVARKIGVEAYLAAKTSSGSKMAKDWVAVQEFYEKKLWHHLTLKLSALVKHEEMQAAGHEEMVGFYQNFLKDFETKINPLALVEIMESVIPHYPTPENACDVLEGLEKSVKNCTEAVALLKILRGNIFLMKIKNQLAAKKLIDDIEEALDEANEITSTHGRYYLLASEYYRQQGKHAEYYSSALKYLGCVDLNEIPLSEKIQHGYSLSLAALLGKRIYNIGELLVHPIIDYLKETQHEWLIEVLHAFNSGDIVKFEQLKSKWSIVPDLLAHEVSLRQKIGLLGLMEIAFRHGSNKRDLSFLEIAEATKLPLNQVELLVMKALAEELVKGSIDQVEGTVHINWVQPRVLNKQQIISLIDVLNEWQNKVRTMETLFEEKGFDILTL